MIDASKLVKKFQYALDNHWGYIYGTTHEMWSAEKQAAYKKQYSNDPDRENSCMVGGKWAGHWVTDCSGLFKWAFSEFGGSIAHGSNAIWNKYLDEHGTLSKGLRSDGKAIQPGTAVFTSTGDKHNHIGLYVGNGVVIEAQGAQAGVVQSLATNKKWTAWGELKNVDYSGEGGKSMYATVVLPTGASGNTVNMRVKPDTSGALVERVPVGATVNVLEDMGQWCGISYNGKTGFMMSNYLEYEGQTGESGGDVVTIAERLTIEAALNEIDKQLEIVRSTLGRG